MTEQYISQTINELNERGAPISAQAARKLASQKKTNSNLNYTLTIKRIFNYIKIAADKGDTQLEFTAPSIVSGGTACDSILLARQIKAKLTSPELGFVVERKDDHIIVNWDP